MTTITQLLLESEDPETAARFYAEALGLGDRISTRGTDEPSTGFRGATVSLIVPDPVVVDGFLDAGTAAGARAVKPATRNLFGYGGTLQAPDGTVVTVATSSKRPHGATPGTIDELVLQLGVTAVAESRDFYVARGTEVAQSYGRKYTSFATGDISLALLKRKGLAKAAGVDAEGSGSRRLAIVGDLGELTDPDGFRWEDQEHDV
ncbi:glyoxalase [Brachybacterium sacelli]|uniref:Lactoylglutathione lyase n=1 Tax=Brachybacterium sacelli TaxID=173364 RepID=A0ABS4X8K2_9MICO|nr:glyoxalase [Brachybacterium sacelli]MBP2384024.1 putative lactoylglutathione lyase [Brachybacterium sacelli]